MQTTEQGERWGCSRRLKPWDALPKDIQSSGVQTHQALLPWSDSTLLPSSSHFPWEARPTPVHASLTTRTSKPCTVTHENRRAQPPALTRSGLESRRGFWNIESFWFTTCQCFSTTNHPESLLLFAVFSFRFYFHSCHSHTPSCSLTILIVSLVHKPIISSIKNLTPRKQLRTG